MRFIDKVRNFELYLQSYETITFFELRSLFGSSLFAPLIFILALPLALFSTQWIAIPLTSVIIFSSIWYFYDTKLWMPDGVKACTLSKPKARKLLHLLDTFAEKNPSPSWHTFLQVNIVLIACAAFRVGFTLPPGLPSIFPVLAILTLSWASLFEQERLSWLGYILFFIHLF